MSEASPRRFGAGAARLSGLAAQALGWRPDHFWAATPAELAQVLAPYAAAQALPLGRDEFNRMMERDDDRHGR